MHGYLTAYLTIIACAEIFCVEAVNMTLFITSAANAS